MKRKLYLSCVLLVLLAVLGAPLASAAYETSTSKHPYPTAAMTGAVNVGLAVSVAVGSDPPIDFSADGLQAALNYVMADTPAAPTDYTIMVSGECGEVIYLEQQQYKNILLDGTGCTMVGGGVPAYYAGQSNRAAGTINIDGMGGYTEPESVTITGFAFDGTGFVLSADVLQNSFIRTFNTQTHFPLLGTLPTNHYVYWHNITVSGCAFFSNEGGTTGYTKTIVGVRSEALTSGQCRLLTMQDCTATNMHSLAQLDAIGRMAGDRAEALEVIGCTLTNCANGINVFGDNSGANGPNLEPFDYLFQNCAFNLWRGYAIRVGNGSGALQTAYPSSVTIDNCSVNGLSSAANDDGPVVLRGGAPVTIQVSNSSLNSATGGRLFSNTVAANRAGFVLDATDNNTWNGLPYCDSASNKIFQMFDLAAGTSSLTTPPVASEIHIVNKVTFDANGGTYTGSVIQLPGYATLNVAGTPRAINWTGTLVQPDELPTRSGYTLAGWTVDPSDPLSPVYPTADLTVAALNTIDPATMDPVLYAVWEEALQVTYHGNNNTGGTAPVDSKEYISGDTVTVLGAGTLTRTGYVFTGWATSAGGVAVYQPGGTFTITGDADLYAVWAAALYVTYDGNGNTGGTAPVDATGYAAGQSVAVLGPGTLTRTGCIFAGWATSANGAVVYRQGDTFVITADTRLYAVWVTSNPDVPSTGDPGYAGWVWSAAVSGLGLLICATILLVQRKSQRK